jgi:hypothetical protein
MKNYLIQEVKNQKTKYRMWRDGQDRYKYNDVDMSRDLDESMQTETQKVGYHRESSITNIKPGFLMNSQEFKSKEMQQLEQS